MAPFLPYTLPCPTIHRGMRVSWDAVWRRPRHSPPTCLCIHRCGLVEECAWKDAEWTDETPTLFAKKSAVSPNWRRCVQAKIGTDVQPVVWFRDVGDREMDFHDMIDPGIHIYGSLVAFFPGIRSSKQDRRRLLARFLGLKPHTVQVLSILSIMPASVLFSRAAATRSLSDSCLDTSPSWACEPSLMRTSTR